MVYNSHGEIQVTRIERWSMNCNYNLFLHINPRISKPPQDPNTTLYGYKCAVTVFWHGYKSVIIKPFIPAFQADSTVLRIPAFCQNFPDNIFDFVFFPIGI